jgi:hypothetical protein
VEFQVKSTEIVGISWVRIKIADTVRFDDEPGPGKP